MVKEKILDSDKMDDYLSMIGFQTRVVAFWYGKEEWREEI